MKSKGLIFCLLAIITNNYYTQVSNQTTNSISNDTEFVVESNELFKYSIILSSELYELEDNYFIEKLTALISNEFNPSFIEIHRKDKPTAEVTLVLPDENQLKTLQRFIENLGFTIVESKKPVLND